MEKTLRVYDYKAPGIAPGTWKFHASQSIRSKKDGALLTEQFREQTIVVERPDEAGFCQEIINLCPLPDTTGLYKDTAVHMVLKEPMYPWLLSVYPDRNVPWLALLVLEEGDFVPDKTDGISSVTLTAEQFDRFMQGPEALSQLVHVRQVGIEKKAEMELDEEGMFSVILSGRLPIYREGETVRNTVHLVSLESAADCLLAGSAVKAGRQVVKLRSLYSYTFFVAGEEPWGFYKMCKKLKEQGQNDFLLQLKQRGAFQGDSKAAMESASQGDSKAAMESDSQGDSKAASEGASQGDLRVKGRLSEGYVPMFLHNRMGDEGLCWYRSPFTPCPVKLMERKNPFFSSDGALIYSEEEGTFDVSLAAAWELGRFLALQDSSYCGSVRRLRKSAQNMTDVLLADVLRTLTERGDESLLKSSKEAAAACKTITQQYSKENIRDILSGNKAKHGLMDALGGAELQEMGGVMSEEEVIEAAGLLETQEKILKLQPLLKQVIEDYMLQNREMITQLLEEELKAAAEWLGKLTLLYPVPCDYLLPHPELLKKEQVKLFYLDENWLLALWDGAISIGIDCERQTALNCLIRSALEQKTKKQAEAYRTSLYPDAAPPVGRARRSGFLIRSETVMRWPTMEISAWDESGQPIALLRMELLSHDTLLGILDGVAATLWFDEPVESLQMKLEENPENLQSLLEAVEKNGTSVNRSSELALSLLTTGDRVVFGKEEK